MYLCNYINNDPALELKQIATFHSPFATKFGIPKQSGLVEELEGTIVFEPEFRNPDYIRGIEGFDHLWLLWEFSANKHGASSPLVRPPVLGGNEKMGVFATRSPFRPNPLGLSCVRLLSVENNTSEGPVLHIGGADIMDGTPIYDIKPYLPYSDAHPEATSGFTGAEAIKWLKVEIPEEMTTHFSAKQQEALRKTLSLDPRPRYQQDSEKTYGVEFLGHDIHFKVKDGVCTVVSIMPSPSSSPSSI